MNRIFLYGPLAWAPLLTKITGSALRGYAAELPGHVLLSGTRKCFPQLQPGDGSVEGIVVEYSSVEVMDSLRYFVAGLGYVEVSAEVNIDGNFKTVTLYRAPQSDPRFQLDWQKKHWRAKWGQIAIFAAEEVSQHKGTIPGEILARMMPMIEVRAAARAAAATGAPTDIRCDLTSASVEVTEEHNSHAGFFLTREYTLRHPEFSGEMTVPVKREVFVATDAAIVLPYDPVRDRVLLVEQFRMGPFGRGDPYPWMLEPVAGRVDPGEAPEETAHRECVEEAGLRLQRLEHIASHYCSLGCSTEYFHCYLGLCDLPELTTGTGGLESEDEDIRTHVLQFDQAMSLIPSGEAANGPLILCLFWLERERQRLRA